MATSNLQMHIRKALRDLKEMLLLAPLEYKPPLQLVQQDLASMDDELLRMLFPLRPGKKMRTCSSGRRCRAAPGRRGLTNRSARRRNRGETRRQTESKSEASPASRTCAENSEEKNEMNIQNCLLTAVVTCGLAVSCAQLRLSRSRKTTSRPWSPTKSATPKPPTRASISSSPLPTIASKISIRAAAPSSNRHGELLNAFYERLCRLPRRRGRLVQLGIEKQENIRQGVDLMASRAKEFLEALNKIAADKIEIDIYKDNLDDAIEGTRDAMNDAEKAKKAVAPPPIRRKN